MGESGAGRSGLTSRRLAAWSALHHGIDPDRVPLLSGWLRGVWVLACPMRAAPPTAVTVTGALCAVGAVATSWPWVALVLVLAATLCDALDGAIAVVADRATAGGALADRVADRISDTAFALVIWRCGAPWWLAVAAATVSLVHEGTREARGGALRARITCAERPTRVVCAVLACVSAAVSDAAWPATVCAAVWVGLGVVGLGQLIRTAPDGPSTAAGRGGAAAASGR